MSNGNQGNAPGLGQSIPLVSVPGANTNPRGFAVPVGNDHPLAANTSPPKQSPSTAPLATSAGPAMMSSPPPNSGPATSQKTSAPTSTAATPTMSLESLADSFLSQPSYRTENLGLEACLSPSPLPREDGLARLRTLVERRAWGDVLKISTSMLNSPKGQHGDVYSSLVMLPLNAKHVDVSQIAPEIREETIEIMTLQCHAWLKLRRYSDLFTEVERWNFLTHNDATAQSPDWLPWSLHILAGQVQQFSDDADRASDILFAIRKKIPEEDAMWLASVDNALANVFLRQSKWRLALGSFDRILELLPEATTQYLATYFENIDDPEAAAICLSGAFRCEILSRQGRTFLQIGALKEAETSYRAARGSWDSISNSISPALHESKLMKLLPGQVALNDGLLDFAKSSFEAAATSFSKSSELIRSGCSLSPKYDVEDYMGPTVAGIAAPNTVYTESVNNQALCALYTCQMKKAVDLLERTIREDPGCFLTERTAFNLCTLYELGSDASTSARRKRVLQLIAKRFFLHDIGPESFRVN